jgi:hypothetical protein
MGVSQEDYQPTKKEELRLAACRELSGPAVEEAKTKIMHMFGITPAEAAKIQADQEKKAAALAPLTEEELEACRLMNVEPIDYYATKMEEAGLKLVLR